MSSPCLRALAVLALVSALPLAACGGRAGDGGAGDAAADVFVVHRLEAGPDSDVIDAPDEYSPKAPHCARYVDAAAPEPFDAGMDGAPPVIALPQVTNLGESTLHRPRFVSVTFPDDPDADELEDFLASVGCTDYWRSIAVDYGVGEAIAGPAVRLSEQAPSSIDDPGVRAWLAQKISGNDPQFPRPAADTVYVVFYPGSTQITLQGLTSCQGFGGYHEGGQLADGTPFSYAVVPRCPGSGQLSGIAGLTTAASHELIEACTDPQPDLAQPGYAIPDSNHVAWALASASEVGDLCEFDRSSYYQPQGFPWYVQRTWSNRAAASGTDPCVPAASPDYFYAAPMLADTVLINLTGTPESVAAVHVPVGGSVTIAVAIVGSASVGTVQVQALDVAQLTGQPAHLGLALDAAHGKPGDTIHLTITKQSGDPSVGAEAFALATSSATGRRTLFFGLTSD